MSGDGVQQQNPDGSWSPSAPLGWQGSGIDWEVQRTPAGFRAEGFDEDVLCHVVESRWRLMLYVKMRRAIRSAP